MEDKELEQIRQQRMAQMESQYVSLFIDFDMKNQFMSKFGHIFKFKYKLESLSHLLAI